MPVKAPSGKVVGLTAKEVADAMLAATAAAMRAMVVECKANLVKATPVLTGWARGNWRMGVGQPGLGVVGRPPKPTKAGKAGKFREPADPGLMSVLKYKPGQGVIFIWNNVPYIHRLNAGYSAKAPAAFVERAIENAIDTGIRAFGDAATNVEALRTR